MKHCDAAGVKRSPFLSNMSQGALCSVVEEYYGIPQSQVNLGPQNYFMFGFRFFFKKMFCAASFPKVGVVKSVNGLTIEEVEGKDVFIVVSKRKPQGRANLFWVRTVRWSLRRR